MGNKILAIAMALIMTLSAATAFAVGSEESDASVADIKEGDSWGFGGSYNLDDLLDDIEEIINSKEQGTTELSKEKILQMITEAINSEIDPQISDLRFDVDLSTWSIAEVVKANSSGYVIESESISSIDITFGMKVTGELPTDIDELEFDENGNLIGNITTVQATADIQEVKVQILVSQNGAFYLSSDFFLTGAFVDTGITSVASVRSNISVEDDGRITYDPSKVNTETISSGFSTAFQITTIDGGIRLLPDADGVGWSQKDVGISLSYMANAFSDNPLDDTDDFSDSYRDSRTYSEDFEVKVRTAQEDGVTVYTMHMQSNFSNEITDKIGDLIDEEFGEYGELVKIFLKSHQVYKYPFEYNYIGPDSLLVNGSMKLDADGKKKVTAGLGGLEDDLDAANADRVVGVTFYGSDGKKLDLDQTVKYGGKVTLPSAPAAAEGKKFVGWVTSDGDVWKEEFPVKFDLELYAEYAKEVTEMPDASDFLTDESILWSTDIAQIAGKTLDTSFVDDMTSLYITVADGDRTVYSWKISGSALDNLDGTKLMPEILKGETPDRAYLKEVADGNRTVYLDFKASGIMPSSTVVSYYVGDEFGDGDTVSVYYDNEKDGAAVMSATSVVIDGYVDIPVKHCSSYILVAEEPPSSGDDGGFPVWIVGAIVGFFVAVAIVFMLNKKKASADKDKEQS